MADNCFVTFCIAVIAAAAAVPLFAGSTGCFPSPGTVISWPQPSEYELRLLRVEPVK